MRKSKEHRKSKGTAGQFNLFDAKPAAPHGMTSGGTGDRVGGVYELPSRLERQRAETELLLEQMLVGNIEQFKREVLEERYGVSAVKKVEIPKPNGGVRTLGIPQVISELNTTIMGWTAYFRKANKWLSDYRSIDGWVRRKLRCYRLKQCGRKYAIFKMLHGMGIPEGQSWNTVMYSQGWWEMSIKVAANQAMSNEWFAQQGLRSIYAEMTRKKR